MTQTLRTLWQIPGGLHLDDHKHESTRRPVAPIPLPAELAIPLQQHMGNKPKLRVQVGDYVYKGQKLAEAEGAVSVPVHASTSGTVCAIENRPVAHPSGLGDLCIILKPDGKDDWGAARLPALDYTQTDAATLLQRIREAGVVGLGGAVFPSAIKLQARADHPTHTLIINGAECEPYITCDDLLMRDKADEIVAGIRVMMQLLNPAECVVGIEDNKPQAIAAMQTAVANGSDVRVQVVPVPTLYPTGGEKQLIKILTGKEVPSGGRPLDIGAICHNVATARAIYRAVALGEPLIARYITVTGEGVAQPCNLEVPFGIPMADLVQHAGGYTPHAQRLLMGGPMMGIALASEQIPVVKATNCLLVRAEAPPPAPVMPCIRCGRCTEVCPASLLPQQLYWFARAKEFDKAENHHLFDCIECGCCTHVCPSHIPLVDYYRFAKAEVRAQRAAKEKAEHARQRHDFQLERQERAKRERAEKLAKHKEGLQTAPLPATGSPAPPNDKQSAIQAALERTKARKAALAAASTAAKEPSP